MNFFIVVSYFKAKINYVEKPKIEIACKSTSSSNYAVSIFALKVKNETHASNFKHFLSSFLINIFKETKKKMMQSL